jgi:hypothetical protein
MERVHDLFIVSGFNDRNLKLNFLNNLRANRTAIVERLHA